MSGILQIFNGGLEMAWKAFIRPPRQSYDDWDLGFKEYQIDGKKVKRDDFFVRNSHGQKLHCSLYTPDGEKWETCIVYLHGNSGSRVSGRFLDEYVIPRKMGLLVFDFAGCGRSEGEFITLGL